MTLSIETHAVHTLAETRNIAAELAAHVSVGDVITLAGDLGAGKTAFAEGFITALNPDIPAVTSPTFNLVKIYDTLKFPIWHFDLYRLQHAEEIYELGLEDALHSGVSLIEWAEIAEDFLPQKRIKVEMSFAISTASDARRIIITH